jgi:hypothetical protein
MDGMVTRRFGEKTPVEALLDEMAQGGGALRVNEMNILLEHLRRWNLSRWDEAAVRRVRQEAQTIFLLAPFERKQEHLQRLIQRLGDPTRPDSPAVRKARLRWLLGPLGEITGAFEASYRRSGVHLTTDRFHYLRGLFAAFIFHANPGEVARVSPPSVSPVSRSGL